MTAVDFARLDQVAAAHRKEYATASPFPHVVLDGLFPVDMLRAIHGEFPTGDSVAWQRFKNDSERKEALSKVEMFGAATREFVFLMNSAPMLRFLETLTGIPALIPDPHYLGGGLHQIGRGGFLKIHADFNVHPRFKLDRRLNVLVYLNDDWPEEYGGHLQLWDRSMTRCERSILPILNRCVVFNTTSDSYHGHPDPVTCPPDRQRRSVAFYYYTNGRPEAERQASHTTRFVAREGEQVQTFHEPSAIVKRIKRAAKILLGREE